MYIYKTVVGIDKLPSYDAFALAVVSEGNVVFRKEIATLNDVMKAAEDHNAGAVAVDNIFEIGAPSEVRQFATRLKGASLIQVTGSPSEGMKTLASVGKELALTSGEKLSPMRSAELCARAAMAGVGHIVKVFYPETRIIISKRRKFGTGGMSAGRFRRSVEGAVLSLTTRIKEALDARKLDYDLSIKRGAHGVDGASFVVYADRRSLFGVARPLRTSSINVRVVPTPAKTFEYSALRSEGGKAQKRHLIVGVDPGMVTGLAVLDLNGRVLHLSSGRGFTRGQITRVLTEYGKPILFASDVSPPPGMISKLAALHKADLFFPQKSLKTFEKSEIVEKASAEQGIKVSDTHQRDALSAALKAYSLHKNKLDQCEAHVRSEGKGADLDAVRALVLKGFSISDAIEAESKPAAEPPQPPKKRVPSEAGRIKALESKLELLELERDALLEKNRAFEEEIDELKNALRLARIGAMPKRSLDSYELERRISSLLNELSLIRNQLEAERSESIRLRKTLEGLAAGSVIALPKRRSLDRDCAPVWTADPRGLIAIERVEPLSSDLMGKLMGTPPAAIIALASVNKLAETQLLDRGVPVILPGSLEFQEAGEWVFVSQEKLDCALSEARKRMQRYRHSKPVSMKDLIEEYKKERMKESLRKE